MTLHISSIEGPYTPLSRVREIEKTIEQTCGVPFDLIKGNSRKKQYSLPRQIAYWVLYKHTELSLPDIGQRFKKDHTTIHHGWRKITKAIEDKEEPIFSMVLDIETSLRLKGFAL